MVLHSISEGLPIPLENKGSGVMRINVGEISIDRFCFKNLDLCLASKKLVKKVTFAFAQHNYIQAHFV